MRFELVGRWEAAMARAVCLSTIGLLTAFCIMPVLLLGRAWGEEVLTNDTIIQMVRGGLPESVVVAKIRHALLAGASGGGDAGAGGMTRPPAP
jgi:hypothetical protein